MNFALVFVGGALGSVTRYGVNLLALRVAGSDYPYGTLVVNLVGCFLIGLACALGSERGILSPSARLFFMTGFLGGLTTFSSYALESVNLGRLGLNQSALIHLAANNLGGLLLVLAGLWVGRIL